MPFSRKRVSALPDHLCGDGFSGNPTVEASPGSPTPHNEELKTASTGTAPEEEEEALTTDPTEAYGAH